MWSPLFRLCQTTPRNIAVNCTVAAENTENMSCLNPLQYVINKETNKAIRNYDVFSSGGTNISCTSSVVNLIGTIGKIDWTSIYFQLSFSSVHLSKFVLLE